MWPRNQWIRKHIAWLIVGGVFMLATLAFGAIDILSDAADRPIIDRSTLVTGVLACAAISLTAFAIFNYIAIVPTRRHVSLHCGRVCKNCLFVLTSLPNRGKCPECGAEYDIEEVRQSWTDMLDAHED